MYIYVFSDGELQLQDYYSFSMTVEAANLGDAFGKPRISDAFIPARFFLLHHPSGGSFPSRSWLLHFPWSELFIFFLIFSFFTFKYEITTHYSLYFYNQLSGGKSDILVISLKITTMSS